VPKIATETEAEQPPNRARKTVGVGEEVTLTLLPEGMSGALWSMTEGSGQVSGYTGDSITFTAPDRADTTTLTVDTDAGTAGSVTFHVIEPKGILFENMSGPYGVSFPNQSFFQVSYGADVYFQPDSVNFYNISVCESAAATQASPGYFQDHPIDPHDSWEDSPRSLSPGTVWVAGKGTRGAWEQGDTIGGFATKQPFTDGYAYWDITWSYKVGTGSLKPIAPDVRQDYRLIVAVENGNTNITFRVRKGASGAEISSGEQEPHFIKP